MSRDVVLAQLLVLVAVGDAGAATLRTQQPVAAIAPRHRCSAVAARDATPLATKQQIVVRCARRAARSGSHRSSPASPQDGAAASTAQLPQSSSRADGARRRRRQRARRLAPRLAHLDAAPRRHLLGALRTLADGGRTLDLGAGLGRPRRPWPHLKLALSADGRAFAVRMSDGSGDTLLRTSRPGERFGPEETIPGLRFEPSIAPTPDGGLLIAGQGADPGSRYALVRRTPAATTGRRYVCSRRAAIPTRPRSGLPIQRRRDRSGHGRVGAAGRLRALGPRCARNAGRRGERGRRRQRRLRPSRPARAGQRCRHHLLPMPGAGVRASARRISGRICRGCGHERSGRCRRRSDRGVEPQRRRHRRQPARASDVFAHRHAQRARPRGRWSVRGDRPRRRGGRLAGA